MSDTPSGLHGNEATSANPSAGIPNLLDALRKNRPSQNPGLPPPTPRGAHLGGSNGSTLSRRRETTEERRDRIVQQTDEDAAGSRLSAVELGYLSDPFARTFWSPAGSHDGSGVNSTERPNIGGMTIPRRMPIINRGTYVRTTAVDTLVTDFLSTHESAPVVQVISLGAGTDTRFFRLMRTRSRLLSHVRYHEIDFPTTTRKKIGVIEGSEELMDLVRGETQETAANSEEGQKDDDSDDTVTESSSPRNNLPAPKPTANLPQPSITISPNKTTLHSQNYHIHALDLRDVSSSIAALSPHIIPTAPTLIVSEMCLTYLPANLSTSFLHTLIHNLLSTSMSTSLPSSLQIILYEPLHPSTPFGRTMIENLSSRGINLPGLTAFPDLAAHGERLVQVGCEAWEGWTVREWWEKMVSRAEKERLRGCEFVDEEEEWELLSGHYGVVKGWRGKVPRGG